MKAMELTVYPPLSPAVQEAVDWNIEHEWQVYTGFGVEANVPGITAMHAKRLTNAELCAEFEAARCDAMIQSQTGRCWQPLGYTWPMDEESIRSRAQTLLRFASSPHYFETAA